MQLILLLLSLFLTSVMARSCVNGFVSLTLTSRNAILNIQPPESNSDVTAIFQASVVHGANYTDTVVTGYQTIVGNYNISTQLCTPTVKRFAKPVIQILSHGVGFDKAYWDYPFANYNYSYVNTANDAGYYTLAFDKLGTGQSTHPEPINQQQLTLDVQALRAVTELVRSGGFSKQLPAFDKVFHVGHSYGSAITFGFVGTYPTLSDGIVLTGFSSNASFQADFALGGNWVNARTNQPFRFGTAETLDIEPLETWKAGLHSVDTPQNLSVGYVVPDSSVSLQIQFFYPGHFNPAIIPYTNARKQPTTIGGMLTLGSTPHITQFERPVLVLTGDNDAPFCGGNCTNTGNPDIPSIPSTLSAAFPNVPKSSFMVYIQPNTGHGLNLHYNSTGAYRVIEDFLSQAM